MPAAIRASRNRSPSFFRAGESGAGRRRRVRVAGTERDGRLPPAACQSRIDNSWLRLALPQRSRASSGQPVCRSTAASILDVSCTRCRSRSRRSPVSCASHGCPRRCSLGQRAEHSRSKRGPHTSTARAAPRSRNSHRLSIRFRRHAHPSVSRCFWSQRLPALSRRSCWSEAHGSDAESCSFLAGIVLAPLLLYLLSIATFALRAA